MIRESVLDGGRRRSWLRIMAGRVVPAFPRPAAVCLTPCPPAAIIDLLQTNGLRGHGQRVLLSNQEIRIMLQRLQDVRDLPKSLQYRLLVISRGFFKGSKGSATFGLSHAAVE